MKKLFALFFILSFIYSDTLFAQETKKTVSKADSIRNETFTYVDLMPEFPGGQGRMLRFINQNLRYPENEFKNKIEGTVFLQFIVLKTGKIFDIKVLGSIPDSPALEKESMRIISIMPDWIAGIQNGDFVNVEYNLPIIFKINQKKK